jgi:hypothetical protein
MPKISKRKQGIQRIDTQSVLNTLLAPKVITLP